MKFTRNTATELSTYPTIQVQVGDVIYNELSEAVADANNSEEDVTISDGNVGNLDVKGDEDVTIGEGMASETIEEWKYGIEDNNT